MGALQSFSIYNILEVIFVKTKKGKAMKIIGIILGIIVGLMLLLLLGLWSLSRQPAVKENYWDSIPHAGVLEEKYAQPGALEVSKTTFDSCDEKIGTIQVWHPANMTECYPAVVTVNGTGVPASKYEAILEHLATWGFIVIGSEDANSWDGVSSSFCLDYLLALNEDADSILYQKIDTGHIGIAGHSQGGVGAINAATSFENSSLYASVYLASTTWPDLAVALNWPYDISKIQAPCFMTAGTGKTDAETITPLSSMVSSFDALDNGQPTVMARRRDTDHGQMLAGADSYMTAWFCWTLKGDPEAAPVFTGADPEIISNTANWQDVRIKNP